MQLSENQVQATLDRLKGKRLVMEDAHTSRVSKYKHKFCNTEFGSWKFSAQQTAIVCLLLLRGPQTPGELRTRSGRLAEFENVQQVEAVLAALADFNGDRLVVRLPREPGKRESRYAHCFSGEPEQQLAAELQEDNLIALPEDRDLVTRVEVLEQEVKDLKQKLDALLEQQNSISE